MTSLSLTTVFILVHVCLHLLKKVNANYACFEQKPKISASCNKHWSLTPSRLEKNFFSSECIDFFEKYPDLQADQCVETIVVSIEAYDSSSAFLARMSLKEENGVFFVPFPDTVNHFYIKRYLVGYGNYYAERINPVEENDSFTFSEVFHFYRVKIPFDCFFLNTKMKIFKNIYICFGHKKIAKFKRFYY